MTEPALKQRLSDAIKASMKAGEKQRLTTLRTMHAAVRQREIDDQVELDDAGVTAVLDKLAKQHRESIAQYRKAGRGDLVGQEERELAIVTEFLPEPLDDSAVDTLIDEAIGATGASSMKDMGAVMSHLKSRLQGRADMSTVSARVKARLG
jgi:uncharacterized protein YqeY